MTRLTVYERRSQLKSKMIELALKKGMYKITAEELSDYCGVHRSTIQRTFSSFASLRLHAVRQACDTHVIEIISDAIDHGDGYAATVPADVMKRVQEYRDNK